MCPYLVVCYNIELFNTAINTNYFTNTGINKLINNNLILGKREEEKKKKSQKREIESIFAEIKRYYSEFRSTPPNAEISA